MVFGEGEEMIEATYSCESCGHPVHFCATVGQCCPVSIIDQNGIHACPCPSTASASDACACQGKYWWVRIHTDSQCQNDYPCVDPNVCHHTWKANEKLAPDWDLYCHKRKDHGGPHSTHNDCGYMTDGHWICGDVAGPDGLCDKHRTHK